MSGFSAHTQSSLEILRKPQLTMHWYVIPIFLLVLYVVTKEMSEKHYKVLLGGLALWGVDLFNEIWNSTVCALGLIFCFWEPALSNELLPRLGALQEGLPEGGIFQQAASRQSKSQGLMTLALALPQPQIHS